MGLPLRLFESFVAGKDRYRFSSTRKNTVDICPVHYVPFTHLLWKPPCEICMPSYDKACVVSLMMRLWFDAVVSACILAACFGCVLCTLVIWMANILIYCLEKNDLLEGGVKGGLMWGDKRRWSNRYRYPDIGTRTFVCVL